MTEARARLRADTTLTGAAWCRAHSDLVDTWLTRLLSDAAPGATGATGATGVALVAVGGYGRQELCPESDIDLMLLHERKANQAQVAAVADRIWYPIWDEGYHLGHSVCTVRQALSLASDTLETATALLSARHLAGDAGLSDQLITGGRQNWEKRDSRWLTALAAGVAERHERTGEAAFRLEPDLKEARGGLRDVHALTWAQAARAILLDYDEEPLASAYSVLLDARVELQRRTGRAANVLVLQEQEGVARALGFDNADQLMGRIAEAARRIAWTSDDTWRRVTSTLRGPLTRTGLQPRLLAPGVVLRDGEVTLTPDAVAAEDPTLALRVAVAAAQHASVIERHTLEHLAAEWPGLPERWPAEATTLFIALLSAGHAAIPVIEALDHTGVWDRIMPEWRAVRCRPQHNAYHRFTVDRHLLETAANAAGLTDQVERPDLLVLGALLHDLGKGHPGDHSEVGVGFARVVGTRMGFSDEDVETLESLVRHHLLLPDVASRRDLDDPVTIERVAEAVLTVERVRLLAALTEADSLATGPSAWSPWKAGLVATLAERVEEVLAGSDQPRPPGRGRVSGGSAFPSPQQLAWLEQPGRHIDATGDVLTVVTGDRPGVFSRVAGVLALHGLDVIAASAQSTDAGRALAEFRVVDHVRDAVPWPRVLADLDRALDGRLALSARMAERVRTYDRPGPFSRRPTVAAVTFDNAASTSATVMDVHTVDRVGVLYRVTRAMAELDLDIRSARVQTLGPEVVDSFYVRDDQGQKVTGHDCLREIERAVLHAVG
ncbi:MAG: [protein-PII] uridylyltransferase [Acidimicrobiaceae bacterium]|nr:[protein-PII] uridylyltransferase [Acidimicrobiaceae bacterium]MDQ1441216.1 [protein-PII] uridylyltransferase [Acidimicrobiaceae bacterium]